MPLLRESPITTLSRNSRHLLVALLVGIGLVLLGLTLFLLYYFNLLPARTYSAADFSIDTLVSPIDFNHNGQDDFADLLLGARADAEQHPVYDGSYVDGGYPPPDRGVCTDVIWRAFRAAGYNLRAMVDQDITRHPSDYPWIETPDTNIDFRRVANLDRFFSKYTQSLTTDLDDLAAWQPGDIVILDRGNHIGIISDRRNRQGRPYVIHNAGQPAREEDYFVRGDKPIAHYRFVDVPTDILVAW